MLIRALIILLLNSWLFAANAATLNNNIANTLASTQLEPGYIAITSQDKLFYLLARSTLPHAPLVIYLSGGPGAASETAAFVQFGPLVLVKPFQHDIRYQLLKNAWSWSNVANVVYLDQPRYTGYSYGSGAYQETLSQTSKDFLNWLKLFYAKYPEFAKRPLYIAGASFAGEYIAQYVHDLLQYNDKYPQQAIPLKGIFVQAGLIGEGQHGLNVSPYYQLDYLCTQHMVPNSACQLHQQNNMRALLDQCVTAIRDKKHIAPADVTINDVYAMKETNLSCQQYLHEVSIQPRRFNLIKIPDLKIFPVDVRGQAILEPEDALEFAQDSQVRRYLKYSPNPYNTALICRTSNSYPPWCYDNYKITRFFNDPAIKSWLGNQLIPANINWQFANFLVAVGLDLKRAVAPLSYYAEALRKHIKVTLIYGKNDFTLNYFAAQAVANKIAVAAYQQALFNQLPMPPIAMQKLTIEVNGMQQYIGEYQQLQDFTFAQINAAGHAVGMDQPQAVNKLFIQLVNSSC
jgi:carboxypeptidase C (cathepsin A)